MTEAIDWEECPNCGGYNTPHETDQNGDRYWTCLDCQEEWIVYFEEPDSDFQDTIFRKEG